jgi:hypothetical protein
MESARVAPSVGEIQESLSPSGATGVEVGEDGKSSIAHEQDPAIKKTVRTQRMGVLGLQSCGIGRSYPG